MKPERIPPCFKKKKRRGQDSREIPGCKIHLSSFSPWIVARNFQFSTRRELTGLLHQQYQAVIKLCGSFSLHSRAHSNDMDLRSKQKIRTLSNLQDKKRWRGQLPRTVNNSLWKARISVKIKSLCDLSAETQMDMRRGWAGDTSLEFLFWIGMIRSSIISAQLQNACGKQPNATCHYWVSCAGHSAPSCDRGPCSVRLCGVTCIMVMDAV